MRRIFNGGAVRPAHPFQGLKGGFCELKRSRSFFSASFAEIRVVIKRILVDLCAH